MGQIDVSMLQKQAVALCVLLFLTGILGIAVFDAVADGIWDGVPVRVPPSNSEYCEHKYLDEALRTRANSWSNLSYWTGGCVLLSFSFCDYHTEPKAGRLMLPTPPAFSAFYGIILMFLGIGSFVFHASISEFGQGLDFAGMGCVLISPTLLAWFKIKRRQHQQDPSMIEIWHNRLLCIGGLLTILIAAAGTADLFFVLITSLPLLLITLVGLEFGTKKSRAVKKWLHVKLLCFALFNFILAFVLRYLGSNGTICNPDSVFQAHALWHFLTAVSLFLIAVWQRHPELQQATQGTGNRADTASTKEGGEGEVVLQSPASLAV